MSEKFVVMFREIERGSDEWSKWMPLSHKNHDTIEACNVEIQKEMDWDKEFGSGDYFYIYRTVTESSVGEDSDLDTDVPVVRSESGRGPLKVAVDEDRLEVLEGIEARLKDTLEACEERKARAQKIIDETLVPDLRTLLAQDDVMRLGSEIRSIKRFLEGK